MSNRTASAFLSFVSSLAALGRAQALALGLVSVGCGGNVALPAGEGGAAGGATAMTSTDTATETETGTGTDTATDTGTGTTAACVDAVPILQDDGTESGFVRCSDGAVNRAFAAACDTSVPACTGDEAIIECTSDADCNEKPNGRCGTAVSEGPWETPSLCGCTYPCVSDDECGAGEACLCRNILPSGPLFARCLPVQCRSNADCPAGECGFWTHMGSCDPPIWGLTCRSSADACRTKAECADPMAVCAAAEGTSWGCYSEVICAD